MKTFENAKVGDKVYSLTCGYGIIERINTNNAFPIKVIYDTVSYETFDLNGKYADHEITPRLYWDKPEIIAPEAPKRMVKKTTVGYCNIYPESSLIGKSLSGNVRAAEIYATEENSIHAAADSAIHKGAKVIIEYEVEE